MSAKFKQSLSKIKKLIAGMTLVEVIVATSILAIVIIGVMSILVTTQPAVNTGYVQTHLDARARLILEGMVNDIRRATTSNIIIDDNNHRLTIDIIGTFSATNDATPVPDGTIRFSLQLAPGEIIDDGIDNNGNGLIDEHHLIKEMTKQATGTTTTSILTKNVEYVGSQPAGQRKQLTFSRLDNKISIKMVLVKADPNPRKKQNTIHRAIVETEVYILNIGG